MPIFMKNSFLAQSEARTVQQMIPYTELTAVAVISVHYIPHSL